MIVVDHWLLELAAKGPYQAKTANLLMRTQVKTAQRSGHLIDLRAEHVRRQITQAANWGKVAQVIVPCMRCGWQAYLTDWVQAAAYTDGEAQEAMVRVAKERGVLHAQFLTPCQGEPYWGYTKDIEALTEPEGE